MHNHPDIVELAKLLLYGVITITAGFTIVGAIAFFKTNTGGAKTYTLFLQRGDVLRIITVSGIVIATFFLAIANVISEDATIAILSGIVGYILGGLGHNKDDLDKVSK